MVSFSFDSPFFSESAGFSGFSAGTELSSCASDEVVSEDEEGSSVSEELVSSEETGFSSGFSDGSEDDRSDEVSFVSSDGIGSSGSSLGLEEVSFSN